MKKFYLSALLLGAFTFGAQAQVDQTEDFESYDEGYISYQTPLWKTWSGEEGGEEDGIVTSDISRNGSQSLLVQKNGDGNDIMYLIEDQPDQGIYSVRMYFYIPTGQEAYFNFQGQIFGNDQQNGSFLTGDHYFNPENQTPGQGQTAGSDPYVWFFPHDEWFPVEVIVDLDTQTYDMFVNGEEAIFSSPFSDSSVPYLGAVDFFAPSSYTKFYVDDITTAHGLLNVKGHEMSEVQVYPNPVQDVLNIDSKAEVEKVTVYDMLGKVVLQATPGAVSPQINMSALPSGTYMVKVTIGKNSKIVKVLK